jgi:hypothetical protein
LRQPPQRTAREIIVVCGKTVTPKHLSKANLR